MPEAMAERARMVHMHVRVCARTHACSREHMAECAGMTEMTHIVTAYIVMVYIVMAECAGMTEMTYIVMAITTQCAGMTEMTPELEGKVCDGMAYDSQDGE